MLRLRVAARAGLSSRKSCSRRKYYAKKKAASPVPVPNKKKADSFKTSEDFLFKFKSLNQRKGRKGGQKWTFIFHNNFSLVFLLVARKNQTLQKRAYFTFRLSSIYLFLFGNWKLCTCVKFIVLPPPQPGLVSKRSFSGGGDLRHVCSTVCRRTCLFRSDPNHKFLKVLRVRIKGEAHKE